MTNTDIAKIRQLLQEIIVGEKTFRHQMAELAAFDSIKEVEERWKTKETFCERTAKQALVLLPCETCNGTGEVPKIGFRSFWYPTKKPCPDCQS